MSRRRKPEPPPPKSSSWYQYTPKDDLYWRLGGPQVPVEEIEPDHFATTYFVSHLKDPRKKVAYAVELIGRAREDLAESVAYYLKLDELGIDAMKMQFYRDQDRDLEKSPNDWSMVARNVDRHRASCYRTIAHRKGQILAVTQLIDSLESSVLPLLFGRGKDLFDT